MEIASIIFLIPILLLIIYQDFKERAISIWLIPALLIAFLLGNNYSTISEYITTVAINLSFLLLQFILLSLYFSIKQKRIINISNTKIGIGDLLFFITLAFAFSTMHFILVFVLGLMFSLILFIVLKFTKLIKQETIPLAGTFSVFIMLIKIGAYLTSYNLINDDKIITKLYTVYG